MSGKRPMRAKAWRGALREWSNEEPDDGRSVQRSEIAAYYKNRDYAPIWRDADGFTKTAKSALDTLRDAGRDGLRVKAPAQDVVLERRGRTGAIGGRRRLCGASERRPG